MIVKGVFRPWGVLLCLLGLLLASSPTAFADRGMVPISEVSVYGPGQKAIIAWDGAEEILILSADVYASDSSTVLEILPLPSEPDEIKKGDFTSFVRIQELIREHSPQPLWDKFKGRFVAPAGEGRDIEILFHEKIGAHDITVVKAEDSGELIEWAEKFLSDQGIGHQISSSKIELESLVESYIREGIKFFVFDLIEVSSTPQSIEPISYRFRTDFLYFPLKISALASGNTSIDLFLLTPQPIDPRQLPRLLNFSRFHGGKPIEFKLDVSELGDIDIGTLLRRDGWLTALKYEGDVRNLRTDLKLGQKPTLLLDYSQGRCIERGESTGNISASSNKVLLSGYLITPTPCYKVEANMISLGSFAGCEFIAVDLHAAPIPNAICIQCLAEIPFSGEISPLTPREYHIFLIYRWGTIAHQRVMIPPSS